MSSQNQNKTSQQQQNQDQKREQDQKLAQQTDSGRKAEIRKAVEQDQIDPNDPQGSENTEFSGGT